MSHVNLNILYDCEFSVPEDANGNEIRNLNGWQTIDSQMSSYNLRTKFENQKVVMFSVIGTFRDPVKINEFNNNVQAFTDAGVDRIICHVVADPFQTYAWAAHLNVPNIEFIADGNGYLATRLGMRFDSVTDGDGMRCWQYASVIENGAVTFWHQEANIPIDDNENINPELYETTTPAHVLEYLQQ